MYRDLITTPAVYEIVNIVNQKCYVGSSHNCRQRIICHLSSLRRGDHHSRYLQRSWDKYGEKAFTVNILAEPPLDELLQKEQYYLDSLKPEYNSSPTAGSCMGYKMSAESRKRISDTHKGRIKTPEHRKKLSQSLMGRELSPESIEKMRKSLKGRTAWNKGISPSDATREKLRQHNLGKKHTLESRQKMSNSLKGRVITPEHARKISIAQQGEKNHGAKLTTSEVIEIKRLLKEKSKTQKEIGDMFNVTRMAIAAISQGSSWRHVEA
jgi:group I intron endonuclease